ncbi:MAG: right-handed parallel beta-helix repeat-containing protein [Paracoccus denitrificans]|uniref:Right-handed parallel beta-helix repeat-containing protein n=1 Tax=Paracoccus denitrificans TaxID=266 RepID=A0A533I8E2_PARDE|nr:MAG: right-handed parallel beta-helix repeat-containing protein [Paracoccus denitrificans]
MNIAITDGVKLMPPSFASGLASWSREFGTPGSATWANQANAAIVSADQDFGSCLEINKVADITRIRFMGETPILPGTYLRISARIKAVAGARPSVRVAGWAGGSDRGHVSGLDEYGPTVSLPDFNEVIEVSGIVGTGRRGGVDMPWGSDPVYGHFGVDLTGPNGGAVRIESVRIEDVTSTFLRDMMDWVDVRDFGAVGNGSTDDRQAFAAADNAAEGRVLVVPSGRYKIGSDLTIKSPVRFAGTLTMPRAARLALLSSFDYPTYAAAFGDETEGLKRALQALFGYTDHCELNLRGRRIDLTEPMIIAELAPGLTSYQNRRQICNGQIYVIDGPAWQNKAVSSKATYNTSNRDVLSNVDNVANIEVGSLITGAGVGREVYVKAKNIGAGTVTLSQPLYGGSGTRTYRFERFRYVFDFIGMESASNVNFVELDFALNDVASGLMLPTEGRMFQLRDCFISGPKDRGITSAGRGCQDLHVDRCNFLSSEMGLPAQDRKSVAININANDTKIRDNRVVRFGTFVVADGGGHLISGNHFFQGDDTQVGKRVPGIVFTKSNNKTVVSGNYIDNCSIEWTNEYLAEPDFAGDSFSFGGLTITGNHFFVHDTLTDFAWISIKPYGSGHYIQGLSVTNNVFLVGGGAKIQRIEKIDTSFADMNYSRMRNILFAGNTFNGVLDYVANPVQVKHTQATAQASWVVPLAQNLPFQGWAQNVDSLTALSAMKDASGGRVTEMPWLRTGQGSRKGNLHVEWSRPVAGSVVILARMDNPN